MSDHKLELLEGLMGLGLGYLACRLCFGVARLLCE